MQTDDRTASESRVGLADLLALLSELREQFDRLEAAIREYVGVPPMKSVLSVEQWLRLHEFPKNHFRKLLRVIELLDSGKTKQEILRIHPSWAHKNLGRFHAEMDRLIALRLQS